VSQVFGPVPSRRLDISLSWDPIPFKTSHWNCFYCQPGRTTPFPNDLVGTNSRSCGNPKTLEEV